MSSKRGGTVSPLKSRKASLTTSIFSGSKASTLASRAVPGSPPAGTGTCANCIQHQGRAFRVLHAFDPNRAAILLIGGDKTGNDCWYETFVPIADRLYDVYLAELKREAMGKARNFKELEAKMPPEARARVAARVKETLENMSLDQ